MNSEACPATETLCELVEGRVDESARAEVEAHLESCSLCRRALAEVARAMAEASDQPVVLSAANSTPPVAASAGVSKLGRYEVRREIGVGGMGVVYEGWDPSLDRKVALKVLRPDREARDRQKLAERLASEARALAKLTHPNVLTVYDVGVDGDKVFVAFELVFGVTMDHGWPHKARGPRERVTAYLQAADGLAAIHRAGLVHRDIKPANILLGDDGRVRVADFGLAITQSESAERGGTPAYMAPEQLGGDASPLSDQFSLAVCIVQALLGERLSADTSASELQRKSDAIWGEAGPCSALWEVLARALRAAPEERFADVAAFAKALTRANAEAPLAAPPSLRRGRGQALASYAALGVAVVAGGAALFALARTPDGTGAGRGLSGVGGPSGSNPALLPSDGLTPLASSDAALQAGASAATGSLDGPLASSSALAPASSLAGPSAPPSAPPLPAVALAALAGTPTAGPNPTPGGVPAALARQQQIQELATAVSKAFSARDGKLCLAKIDELARVDASTAAGFETVRAPCEMLVGQCAQGAARLERAMSSLGSASKALVDNYRSSYCPIQGKAGGQSAAERLRAIWHQSILPAKSAAPCVRFEAELKRALADHDREKPDNTALTGANWGIVACYASAGDCVSAARKTRSLLPEEQREERVANYLANYPKCAKVGQPPAPTP